MVNIVCNHKNKFYDAGVVINSLPVYNDLSTFIMYANAHHGVCCQWKVKDDIVHLEIPVRYYFLQFISIVFDKCRKVVKVNNSQKK